METGSKLGHYEIVDRLGAGGMGEVYRARDTKLRREVALKVLSAKLVTDETFVARFDREAMMLASLNHPNIAAIYGFEEFADTPILVLELVEGETLGERLSRGRLSVDDALQLGLQVVEALAAAHEKDVIHRDLKPSNVMITPKGAVKILDFGIAKSVGPEGSVVGDMDLTATGALVGTAPYMSPEQIRGQAVDQRSDIWSFGCLMFEMLTGQRAFKRETVADTLAAIIEHQPVWTDLPPDTPAGLRTLMDRALQKDVTQRLCEIADARHAIKEMLEPSTATSGVQQAGNGDSLAAGREAAARFA